MKIKIFETTEPGEAHGMNLGDKEWAMAEEVIRAKEQLVKTGKAKLTQYADGKIVIEPYAHTECPRYKLLLKLDYGTLTTTRQHYRLLLMLPHKEGLLEAVNHIMADATKAGGFLTRLFFNGGDER